jgi:NTP pyrophosphatase (non-canonical NTP hydrolase)
MVIRKDVGTFADKMEQTLKKHDGVKSGWEKESLLYLLGRLDDEIYELHEARSDMYQFDKKETREDFKSELVDVANMCMMIYCNIERMDKKSEQSEIVRD